MCTYRSLIIVLCKWFLVSFSTAISNDISGYYWRDYVGSLPYDALPGGIEGGRTTYIGQALFKQLLVPAKIVPEENRAYLEWGFAVHSANESVKILCSSHPEHFHWTRTSTRGFEKITDKHFVVAGLEPPTGTLYVGREKNEHNDVILGKLLFNNDGAVLHSAYRGQAVMHWEFEVLYYDPIITNKQPNKNTGTSTCSCKDKLVNINLFC